MIFDFFVLHVYDLKGYSSFCPQKNFGLPEILAVLSLVVWAIDCIVRKLKFEKKSSSGSIFKHHWTSQNVLHKRNH